MLGVLTLTIALALGSAAKPDTWEFALVSDPDGAGAWRVDIHRDRRVEIARDGEAKPRWIKLTPRALERIRAEVRKARVTDLKAEYGNLCLHCQRCDVMVQNGKVPRWISVAPFETDSERQQHREVARVLRIIDVIREEVGASSWPDGCR
jgi:hypothetical protein